MKKKILILIVIMGFFIISYSKTTQGWFLDSKTEINNFTTGILKIKLTEDFQEPMQWKSGTTTPKTIKIENIGTERAYVRVWAIGEWQEFKQGNWVTASNPTLPIDNVNILMDSVSSTQWIRHTDGAYYYKNILNPGEEVKSPLKLNVTLKIEDKDTRYNNKRFKIKVVSEAVQVTHSAYLNVWGINVPEIINKPSP